MTAIRMIKNKWEGMHKLLAIRPNRCKLAGDEVEE